LLPDFSPLAMNLPQLSRTGRLFCALCVLSAPLSGTAAEYPPFQPLVDAAAANAELVPEAGTYSGPVVIDRPLTIDGRHGVTIDAGGKGTVIYLDTDGAVIRNLRLTRSGESHNDIDAGIQVRGNFNVIKDNLIDDCLFGIDLQQAENNILRRNRISSKPFDLGVRGDAVRLWYSFNNKVTDNVITGSRDMVVWYSKDNLIARNTASGGRYALHFMYSKANQVEENHYTDNSVGIFLMYSDDVVVRNNTVSRAVGATGMGIGSKESSGLVIEGNQLLNNATGLYLDVSPYQPDTSNRVADNLIAYNGTAIEFHNDWTGNFIEGNRFRNNLTQVLVRGGGSAARNHWQGNYWDDYAGFDRDGDGVGDTPHELFAYADRLWMDVSLAQFFKGSPMLEVLDFLERLAPFSPPQLLLRDTAPRLVDNQADSLVAARQGAR
jgi:nitrous oxidase accessory protein